ncbi:MAG: hypothetical protein CVV47_10525 [Spirochaetae bacterium HGW-Spirochaetae-3]|jgi:diguanylate cyclase (GGDEF)-like protein|nr:MAG: hypothetical protein CVV47_10525 [Spirochaetae bacterium HGW-Spirochaetae-3]
MQSITIRCGIDERLDCSLLESAREEVAAYPPERVLIQVYYCVPDTGAIETVLGRLSGMFPGCPVIGANANGGILNGQSFDGAIIVNFSLFESTAVKTVLITQNKDMGKAGLETAAALADPSLRAVIAFGCGIRDQVYLDNGLYLKSLSGALNGVPVSGGLAGAESGGRFSSFVFSERGLTQSGFAAAALSGPELRVFGDFDIDWIPVGKRMTITGMRGRRVFSIDDRPVTDLYRQYLGIASNLVSVDLINRFPLMRNRHGVDLTDLVSVVHEDGSVDFIQKLNIGEQVRFGICDAGLQEDGVRRVNRSLRAFRPDGVFYFACPSRRMVFGETIDADMATLIDMPASCGIYTFGEFHADGSGEPLFFHQAMSVLAVAEGTVAPDPGSPASSAAITAGIGDSDKYVQSKALIHLTMSITRELEETNRRLTEMAHTDGLTGLGNRRKFDDNLDRAIKTHARSGTSFALIMLDVDHFKLFNDLYGHVDGDDCLRSLGHVLREALHRAGDFAFRYGGEEFACILSPASASDAAVVAERIRSRVETVGIPHRGSPTREVVTISIGALLVDAGKGTLPSRVVEECDALLYEAKKAGRNRVVCRGTKRTG